MKIEGYRVVIRVIGQGVVSVSDVLDQDGAEGLARIVRNANGIEVDVEIETVYLDGSAE